MLLAALAAAAVLAPNSSLYDDSTPPPRFHGDKRVVVEFTDQRGIDIGCHPRFGPPPAGMKTNGCATGKKIIVPNPCDYAKRDGYAQLLCHELAHMNGWPSTHGE